MLSLLQFLYRIRVFGLFLLLEAVSLWLFFSYNNRYNTYLLNSSNYLAGTVSESINSINFYFGLQEVNEDLALENITLRRSMASRRTSSNLAAEDSSDYQLVLAKVVNSSLYQSRNFLTIRVDPTDSILPGMGVVSSNGIVGRVKSVSEHFATVTSVLNPNLLVSARVLANGALSTVQWDGEDPITAELKYVPRHLSVSTGDSVVTSGFDSVFPENYPIGQVTETELRTESPFHDTRIRLATDFTRLRYVYVVQVKYKEEKIQLEQEVIE